jgi:hypothetical protein
MTTLMVADWFMDLSKNPYYYGIMVALLVVLIVVWRVMKGRGGG